MSRDQRPGKVRIIAPQQAPASPKRRHDDMAGKRAIRGTTGFQAAGSSAARSRGWMIIPLLLFVTGFVAGGLITAMRDVIQVLGL